MSETSISDSGVQVEALPKLPTPDIRVTAFGEVVPTNRRPFVMGEFFTAEQMREYALAARPLPVAALSDAEILELAKAHTWFNGSHAMTNYVSFARALLRHSEGKAG